MITKEDWKKVYDTMVFYRRTEGFVDFVGKKLVFFDSAPMRDEGACFVTIDNVKNYMK
jgi:hypothetical protein